MKRILKLFGERNTGTRAMTKLVRQVPGVSLRIVPQRHAAEARAAFEADIRGQIAGPWRRQYLHAQRDAVAVALSSTDPWKHAVPVLTAEMVRKSTATIIMVRNPYSWLIALARRPYHIKGPKAASLEAFAARPWMTERRDGMAAVLPSPVDLWSGKVAGALRFREEAGAAGLGCEIVRFEDFIEDPPGRAAAALLALGIAADGIEAVEENTKPAEAPLAELQAYYREERWRSWLSRETVARVNARVDWEVAGELGYARLEPEGFPERLPAEVSAAIRREMASLVAPSDREAGAAAAT